MMYSFDRKHIFLIGVLLFSLQIASQDHLKNTFSSWHEMHGGMEGSGIQRTESFLFVASKKIKMTDVYLDKKQIELNKNDSIQINRFSHLAYPGDISSESKKKNIIQVDPEKRFRVFKKNRCYYISVQYPYEWDGILEYTIKKKKYKSKIKEGFDKGNSDYAP